MSTDTESRFAHLLQPIRVLADNWNIDIARELEDYLGELEKISFSFDGEANSLNFAEAALVIQGSAVVYSKKVEYLYALLYQTLDYLLEKKRRKSSHESSNENNDDAADAEPDFLSLDDALEEGKGIDLVEGDKPIVRPARISNHLIIQSLQSDIEPSDPNNELPKNGGRRSDYSMNTFIVDSTGALVQPHDAGRLSDLHSTQSREDTEMDLGTNAGPSSNPDQSARTTLNTTTQDAGRAGDVPMAAGGIDVPTGGIDVPTGGIDVPTGGISDDEHGDPDDDDDNDDDDKRPSIFEQFSSMNKEGEKVGDKANVKEGVRTGVRPAPTEGGRRSERPKKRLVDMWAMLDPHEEVGPAKAFKKGKPYRIRQSTKPEPETDAVVPIISIAETPLLFRGVRGTAFQEFAYLYSAELKRRKEAKKRDKLEFSFEDTVYAAAEEEEEAHEVPEFTHDAHFNGAPTAEAESVGLDAGGIADDDDDDDNGDPGDAFTNDEPSDTQTYEDFYAARVEQFIAETAQYAQETNLTKRVNDWKTKLAPVLEEQESHKNFDILEYGDTLIHTLRDEYEGKKGVTINEDGDVDADSDLIVPFSKLTVNTERYEVARRFAAMLQLVNNQNVAVITDHKVDSLSFQLLSVKPKYDIENYLAPSLNPSSTPSHYSPLKKSDKTKTKPKQKAPEKEKGAGKGKRGRPAKARAEEGEEEEGEEASQSKKTKGKEAKGKGKGKGKKGEEEEEEEEESESSQSKKSNGKAQEKGKGKKGEVAVDKENVPVNRETRGKRKERVQYTYDEGEEEEEVLRGPRTKMFTAEVAV